MKSWIAISIIAALVLVGIAGMLTDSRWSIGAKPVPAKEDTGWLQRNAEKCGQGYIIIQHGGFEICVPYKLPNEAMR